MSFPYDGPSRRAEAIRLEQQYGAHNYIPLDVVIAEAQRVWVTDTDGATYMDMLSSYSAVNHGHRHPKIIQALKNQADKVTLTSRAFRHEELGKLYKKLAELTGKSRFLAMNTGAEAVETAIKAARRWAYQAKKVPENQAEIIVCDGNFHGRTVTITSFSTEEAYRQGYGPFTPGFTSVPFGDLEAMNQAITPHTAAVLIEPIQGEAGIVIPPKGYLKQVRRLCTEHRVLLMADEIQTGLGRTGKTFACDWEHVTPDMYILGKALGGGVLPISVVAAEDEVMNVFDPGSHGSTFGGNPLACAVALAALEVLEEERLAERALKLGTHMLKQLKQIRHPAIVDIRGKGLLIGIELSVAARPFCERLMKAGLLCKETHDHIIRLAPPLVITKDEIDLAVKSMRSVMLN